MNRRPGVEVVDLNALCDAQMAQAAVIRIFLYVVLLNRNSAVWQAGMQSAYRYLEAGPVFLTYESCEGQATGDASWP